MNASVQAEALPIQTPVAGRLSLYRELSKSGIVALVLISVLGGYLIGHSPEAPLDWTRLLVTLFGILFLASGSSALNQIQERDLDSTMPRTAKRPLPSGRMTENEAWAFTAISLSLGFLLLGYLGASLLAYGCLAVLSYNGLYTLWWKRHWAYAAVPGAVPGALPILMGYASASRQALTPGGIYLFFILFFWQMPHFWVLALRFKDDYEKGGFPTLPVARGSRVTIERIVIWSLAYVGLALIAPLFLHVGWIYLLGAVAASLKLLAELRSFVQEPESKRWLGFFLWVNFSLIAFVAAAVVDLWTMNLFPGLWTG
jgi:protoheme IX farnesyltransferase